MNDEAARLLLLPDPNRMNGGRIRSRKVDSQVLHRHRLRGHPHRRGALYLFVLGQKHRQEMKGFDPNRPVQAISVLQERLKGEEYFVTRQNGTQRHHSKRILEQLAHRSLCRCHHQRAAFPFRSTNTMAASVCPLSANQSTEIQSSKRPDTTEGHATHRSAGERSDAHLGHLFPDKITHRTKLLDQLRRPPFHSQEEAKDKGYESYLPLFDRK